MPKKLYAMRFDEALVAAFDVSARERELSRTAALEKLMQQQLALDAKRKSTLGDMLKGKP